MRIGMFTDSYFPQISGVSTSIKILKDELEARGHEVIIFTTTDPNAVEEKNIVRLTSIPFFSFKERRIAVKGFSKALKEARKYQIDIIHTHTEFSLGLAGKYVAKVLDIPNIHTYHTMYEKYVHYFAKGKIIRKSDVGRLTRMFCNRTSGIIVPSQLMKDMLLEYGVKTEIRVIPTGITIPATIPNIRETIRPQLGLDNNDLVLLSLSRLAFEKNLHKTIEAFPQVLQNYPHAKLVFVGDGPARDSLELMVQDYDIQDYVRFVGEVAYQDVPRYYQMADIYVNASESETQGLTYLESIANGCPVVAKRNDYLSEIIRNPALGSLFEKDEDMADHIIQMVQYLVSHDSQWDEENLLREISAPTFSKRVLSYYRSAIENEVFETEIKKPILKFRKFNQFNR
ncbi:glycosyltransferase family 4 protein [Jeotgalibaca sp. A127]|uniref:glycosyltransferase family 4 protein n=1 Tax=Jeotgalibaca sp. A127 TaxID=3457324 RepID=UPI003FD45C49